MTNFQIEATQLNELFWNLALFTPKNGTTDGRALINVIGSGITGLACDDYIVIQDRREVFLRQEVGLMLTVSVADLKTIETWSRKAEGLLTVGYDGGQLTFVGEGSELKDISQTIESRRVAGEMWSQIGAFVDDNTLTGTVDVDRYEKWALNPDRLKNIPRLKIPDDHPVDFRMCTISGFEDVATWQFKYGPTIIGCVMPMDREVLKTKGVSMWN